MYFWRLFANAAGEELMEGLGWALEIRCLDDLPEFVGDFILRAIKVCLIIEITVIYRIAHMLNLLSISFLYFAAL